MREISPDTARRIALAAHGFDRPRPAKPGKSALLATVRRLGVLQIDSVNVFARAHHIPPFSRLGPYDTTLLDRLAYRDRVLFEYWAHQACYIPVEHYALFRHRMERAAWVEKRFAAWAKANARYLREVRREVADRGPLGAGDLRNPGERAGPWWGWPKGKAALEWLFLIGTVSVSGRRNFERLYDLTERVIPAAALSAPVPSEQDSRRALLAIAAKATGIATLKDLAGYFLMTQAVARPGVQELVEQGELEPVTVQGWREQAYLARGAKVPRALHRSALINPFDPVVWSRDRASRVFGFDYRIEIYVPAPKRVYGYYVLPFLHGDRLVARVDLKADRAAGALLVRGAHAEDGIDHGEVAPALASELTEAARWLGLSRVEVSRNGGLSRALAREVR